jgi:hypothetical protein
MRRTLLTLIAFAALSAWVSAQGPSPLTAETQIKQFQSNRILIGSLVDRGIDLSNADNPLDRAEKCRITAQTMAHYLGRAAEADDADRVAEFASLYGEVIRDGLLPNLDAAKKDITDPKSPEAVRLKQLNDRARGDLTSARSSIPTTGKVGDSDKVKAALAVIDELASRFGR